MRTKHLTKAEMWSRHPAWDQPITSPMGHTNGQRAASCHTACSPVTCKAEQCTGCAAAVLSLPRGNLAAQGGTSHSSALSAARLAAPSCLPVTSCPRDSPPTSSSPGECSRSSSRREGAAHRGCGQVVSLPICGQMVLGQLLPRNFKMRVTHAWASYQPGRHPKKPRTREAQDSAQDSSLDHTCALGTHFPTSSSEVCMQMCTCTGRGDTCHHLDH